MISPLLANIYLHYVLDLWAERWRQREATGDMIIVRYADDFIVGFQHEADARRFLDEIRERMRKFALLLHPRRRPGSSSSDALRWKTVSVVGSANRRPCNFRRLHLHLAANPFGGKFQIKRKTRRDRMGAKLRMIKEEMWRRMHQPIPLQGKWLRQVVMGYFNYHAVPTNHRCTRDVPGRDHQTVAASAKSPQPEGYSQLGDR